MNNYRENFINKIKERVLKVTYEDFEDMYKISKKEIIKEIFKKYYAKNKTCENFEGFYKLELKRIIKQQFRYFNKFINSNNFDPFKTNSKLQLLEKNYNENYKILIGYALIELEYACNADVIILINNILKTIKHNDLNSINYVINHYQKQYNLYSQVYTNDYQIIKDILIELDDNKQKIELFNNLNNQIEKKEIKNKIRKI